MLIILNNSFTTPYRRKGLTFSFTFNTQYFRNSQRDTNDECFISHKTDISNNIKTITRNHRIKHYTYRQK